MSRKPESPIEKPESVKKPESIKRETEKLKPSPPLHRWYQQFMKDHSS